MIFANIVGDVLWIGLMMAGLGLWALWLWIEKMLNTTRRQRLEADLALLDERQRQLDDERQRLEFEIEAERTKEEFNDPDGTNDGRNDAG
jgi:hypothetical protein